MAGSSVVALQAVVFDFDGVVANSEPLHFEVYRILLHEEGIPFTTEEYYERYLGFDDVGAFEAMARDKGLRIGNGRLQSLIGRKTEIFQSLVRKSDVLFPGAAACLQACAAAVPVAIASGALREEIELILRTTGLEGIVPVIVAAGETPRSKPAPDPYTRAMELLSSVSGRRVSAGRAVAIEDSRWGLQSARAAGMRTVALTTSYPEAELGEADLVLPDISRITPEVLDALCRSGGSD